VSSLGPRGVEERLLGFFESIDFVSGGMGLFPPRKQFRTALTAVRKIPQSAAATG
jgi:hypothetical protein